MLQYNVNKLRLRVMISLFESDDIIIDYNILAMQKSWRNSFQTTINNKLSQYFNLHYQNVQNTRICFYINKRLSIALYTIQYRSSNLSTVSIELFEKRKVNIHNIYNLERSSTDENTLSILMRALEEDRDDEHIIMSDFNLHHSDWDETEIRANAKAYNLIILTKEYDLKRTLSTKIIIWRQRLRESTINLTFVTKLLQQSVKKCRITKDIKNHLNHYSVRTKFNLKTKFVVEINKRNWVKIDVKILRETTKKLIEK